MPVEMEVVAGEEIEKATLWQEISRSFYQLLGINKV